MSLEKTVLGICNILNHIIPKKQNQVFFYSTPDYSDNARTVYEQMIRDNLQKDYSIVWAVRDYEKYSKELRDVKVVRHRSIGNLWQFCRSKYIFRTHSLWGNMYVPKRQVMSIVWHGMPLKKLVQPDGKIKPVKCDLLTSTAPIFDQELSSSMGLPSSVCKHVGLPRNDELFRSGNELAEMYPDFKKRIIWMPTFRQAVGFNNGVETELGIPCVNKTLLTHINNVLKDREILLILKLHPWSAEKLDGIEFSNIKCLKDNEITADVSLYKLIGQTDALITDYSSVYIDYMLIDKPICFVYDDMDEYRKTRGFALEPAEKYMPGEHIHDCDHLLSWFCTFEEDKFKDKRNELKNLFYTYPDGESAKRLLSELGIL